MVAARELVGSGDADSVLGLSRPLVGPHRPAVEDNEPPAGKPTTLGDDDSFRPLLGHLNFRREGVGSILQGRSRSFGNPDRSLVIIEYLAASRQAGFLKDCFECRLGAEVHGQDIVPSRFGPPEILELAELLRVLLRQVFGLGEIFLDVVELPREALRDQALRFGLPGEDEGAGAGEPAVVIDPAIAEHLEVLGLPAALALGSSQV